MGRGNLGVSRGDFKNRPHTRPPKSRIGAQQILFEDEDKYDFDGAANVEPFFLAPRFQLLATGPYPVVRSPLAIALIDTITSANNRSASAVAPAAIA